MLLHADCIHHSPSFSLVYSRFFGKFSGAHHHTPLYLPPMHSLGC